VDIAAFLLIVAMATVLCYYIGNACVSRGYIDTKACAPTVHIIKCQIVETLIGFLVSLAYIGAFIALAGLIYVLWQCCSLLTSAANKIEEDIIKRQSDEITAVV
jgi:hypothetical protein